MVSSYFIHFSRIFHEINHPFLGVLHLWKPSFNYQMMTGGVAIPRSPQAFVAILVMVCVAQAWTKKKKTKKPLGIHQGMTDLDGLLMDLDILHIDIDIILDS